MSIREQSTVSRATAFGPTAKALPYVLRPPNHPSTSTLHVYILSHWGGLADVEFC